MQVNEQSIPKSMPICKKRDISYDKNQNVHPSRPISGRSKPPSKKREYMKMTCSGSIYNSYRLAYGKAKTYANEECNSKKRITNSSRLPVSDRYSQNSQRSKTSRSSQNSTGTISTQMDRVRSPTLQQRNMIMKKPPYPEGEEKKLLPTYLCCSLRS